MKKSIFFKLTLLIITLTTIVVSVFSVASFASGQTLPWNVAVGIKYKDHIFDYNLAEFVGDLTAEEINARAVYSGKKGKLQVVEQLISDGFESDIAYCYLFPHFKVLLDTMTSIVNKNSVDATVKFTPNKTEKFIYTKEKVGIEVDTIALFKAMINACGRNYAHIELPTKAKSCVTVDNLKASTTLRASFSTGYSSSGYNRSYNVELATKKVSGAIVPDGGFWSFNEFVGERDELQGYKNAKVIVDGQYVDGFGGGVCQVSTTLYNAFLLADVTVAKVHQHTLVSSYVPAGFDAMVAYPHADLAILNDTGSTIYIEGITEGRKITFNIYGVASPYKVVRESVEMLRVPYSTQVVSDEKKYPDLIYQDETKVIRSGSDYVRSESYLNYYREGVLQKRILIRKNTYKLVDMLIAQGRLIRPLPIDLPEN